MKVRDYASVDGNQGATGSYCSRLGLTGPLACRNKPQQSACGMLSSFRTTDSALNLTSRFVPPVTAPLFCRGEFMHHQTFCTNDFFVTSCPWSTCALLVRWISSRTWVETRPTGLYVGRSKYRTYKLWVCMTQCMTQCVTLRDIGTSDEDERKDGE